MCKFTNSELIIDRVSSIQADDNKLTLESGQQVDYDILALDVGSKTKQSFSTPGVLEHALTTRPINELLPKII